MTRKKSIAVLLSLLLLLAVGYIVITVLTTERKGFSDGDGNIVVNTIRQSSIAEMEYEMGGEKFDFYVDTAGNWYYRPDEEFPVDPSYMVSMTSLLSKITATREISGDDINLEEFGLKSPTLDLLITDKGGAKTHYKVGILNDFTSEYYFSMEGRESVYTIGPELVDGFSKKLIELAKFDEAPTIPEEALKAFEINYGGETFRLEYVKDPLTVSYTDSYIWFITDPYKTYPARTAKVTNLLSTAVYLPVKACAAYKPLEAELESYGLSNPRSVARLDYTVTKTVTSPVGGTATVVEDAVHRVLIGDDRGDGYTYVMVEGSDMVGLALTEDIGELISPDPHSFLPGEVFLMDTATIDSMDVSIGGKTYKIVRKVEKTDGGESVSYSVDGREGDAYYIEEFLNKMYLLGAESLATKETSEDPELSITFHRNTDTFKTMTFSFIKYDLNFYLVDFNDRRELLVNKRDVEEVISLINSALTK